MQNSPIDIQAELDRLETASNSADHHRASLFNLVVYCKDQNTFNYLNGLINMVVEQFPCRIFFIYSNAAPSLAIRVSLRNGKGYIGISSEEILIETNEKTEKIVPFLMLPHFITDLPIYLLWGNSPGANQDILAPLEKLATRLIFDGVFMPHMKTFSEQMLSYLNTTSVCVLDMHWIRIRDWRATFASLFETEETFAYLTKATALKITYHAHSQADVMQAFYLQAWLATCLNWQFLKLEKDNFNYDIYYQNASSEIKVSLIPTKSLIVPVGEIIDVQLLGQNQYLCHLERQGIRHVTVTISNALKCDLPFNRVISRMDVGRDFIREVFYQHLSKHYVPTLHFIQHMYNALN